MLNTLVAKNPGGNFGSSFDTTIFGDHNLSDDNTFGFAGRGIGADNVTNLLLGPLANNGGLTMTHMPQPGSAAIDAGTSNGAPSTDQRGVTRPQLAGFDVRAEDGIGRHHDLDAALGEIGGRLHRVAIGNLLDLQPGLLLEAVESRQSPFIKVNDLNGIL